MSCVGDVGRLLCCGVLASCLRGAYDVVAWRYGNLFEALFFVGLLLACLLFGHFSFTAYLASTREA
jgi:hypothetical protein